MNNLEQSEHELRVAVRFVIHLRRLHKQGKVTARALWSALDELEKMTNKEKFIEELEKAYSVLFEADSRFVFLKIATTPKDLAIKMANGLATGSASKDGEGVKLACRACGIKNTYKDLRAFLN